MHRQRLMQTMLYGFLRVWPVMTWLLAVGVAIWSAPVSAAECGPLKLLTSVPLKLDPGNRPLVPITIEGKPRFLLLDTGGVVSTITPKAVEQFQLKPRRSDIAQYDVNGNRLDRIVPVPTMMLGKARGASWLFIVLAHNFDDETIGTLSPDIIRQFDVDLDFPNRTLNLFSPDHCAGKIMYWRPRALAELPITIAQSGHILIPVTLDGQRLTALVDTGADQTVLNENVAVRRFGLAADTAAAGSDPIAIHEFQNLTLEGITVTNPRVGILPDKMKKAMPFNPGSLLRPDENQGLPDMIIGQSLLSRYHVYVAYRDRMLYITEEDPAPAAH